MPKRISEPVKRYHIHLHVEDVERIDAIFGQTIGRNEAIRMMVHNFLNYIETSATKSNKPIELTLGE